MKPIIKQQYNFLAVIALTGMIMFFSACEKGEIPNLNTPQMDQITINPNKDELNNLVTGVESGMRLTVNTYYDAIGIIGREIYRFATSEPRWTGDLLGSGSTALDNNGFYTTNPWAARYRVVRQANLLLEGAANSTFVSEAERKGFTGFAKTIMAYQLLLNLNLTYTNGIRVDVKDPKNLGPFVEYPAALAAIATMLDEGKADLSAADIIFNLSDGFAIASTKPGLIQFNRALAARVALYRQLWAAALTALNESFLDINGPFARGVFHAFGTGTGDLLNPCFIAQNQTGEIRVAHPSYLANITPGDDRIGKATLRTSSASQNGLSSNRDVWVYTSNTAPIPIIRNEELILIYAEAKLHLNSLPDAIVALNRIRTGHNLPVYAGPIGQADLINEVLAQRRYSLFYEGHRWVDLRRYNRLATLPIDRAGDDVWSLFPRPITENAN